MHLYECFQCNGSCFYFALHNWFLDVIISVIFRQSERASQNHCGLLCNRLKTASIRILSNFSSLKSRLAKTSESKLCVIFEE